MKTYKVSQIGLKISSSLLFIVFTLPAIFILIQDILLEGLNSDDLFPELFFGFMILMQIAFWLIAKSTTIYVDSKKLTSEFIFLFKTTTTLEAHQIEGVDIGQGVLARKFNYGRLTVTGTGGKKIRTQLLDSPEEVAKEIRKINPKLS